MIDKLYIKGMVLGDTSITTTSFMRIIVIIIGDIIDITIFRVGSKEIFNIKSGMLFSIMITTISNRHKFIIKFRLINHNYNRSNMFRGRYRFLSLFTPLHLLLSIFRRERLERKILRIT